jgi:uncharacterized protein YebE (UPF0316 family)
MELTAIAAPMVGVVLIFTLRVVGVAVGTVRNLLTVRGMEWSTSALGFLEVLIYVLSIGVVVNDLTNVANLVGYCAGFSAGNIVGIRIERNLAMGTVTLQAMSQSLGRDIADELRSAGYGATLGWGEGMRGPVAIVTSVVPRRHINQVKSLITAVDHEAFVIVGSTQAVNRGWLQLAGVAR